MSLQVRHEAWLHAVPEKAKNDKSEGEEISRAAQFEKSGIDHELPPFDGPQYMLDMFWEVGPVMAGGMGSAPVSHAEIESWQRNIGIKLTPWECRTLKRLSIEYANESQRAVKRDCPAPWAPPEASIEQKKQVAKNMAEMFREMASGKG